MRIPGDAICKVCQGVFCCAECRHKHEIKNHAISVRKPIAIDERIDSEEKNVRSKIAYETIYLFCPICEKRPLALEGEMHTEMLIHIESRHLPLRCEKCFKVYNKIDDLKAFTKCVQPSVVCQSQELLGSDRSCYTDEASKVTVTKVPTSHCMTVQNSPTHRHDFNENHMTPISIINMRWKAKSKLTHEEFISDSVSSIKNISSISNNSSIRRSNMGVTSAIKGKVIRCSSTPVHLEMMFAKPKEQTFNATGCGQMSSIQYNSSCESDISPAFPQPNGQAMEPVNRYIKVPGPRPRMSTVTPLRQVMSKSIQKAFAEHGLTAATSVQGSRAYQRKKMFDSTSSPDINIVESPQPPALDLRLSPAVRRSQSECGESLQHSVSSNSKNKYNELPNLQRKILLSAQKLTTESIVITRTEHLASISSSTSTDKANGSVNSIKPCNSTNALYKTANNSDGSVFKSCSSVEIITATTEELKTLESENVVAHSVLPLTPITRIPGAFIHKKLINFETPKIESFDSRESQSSPGDVFFTPNATPTRESSLNCDKDRESFKRKLLVKQNLSGRFSPIQRPSIKECTAFSRIENIKTDFDNDVDADFIEDEVFLQEEPKKSTHKSSGVQKENDPQQYSGLWSLVSSVMRLPLRKRSQSKDSPKNPDSYVLVDANSNSIIKRCASIAGSLVCSKTVMDGNELSSLKRKRTYTTDNQFISTSLAYLNNSEATSATYDNFNNKSKRIRIQGRRPIERMRLNS